MSAPSQLSLALCYYALLCLGMPSFQVQLPSYHGDRGHGLSCRSTSVAQLPDRADSVSPLGAGAVATRAHRAAAHAPVVFRIHPCLYDLLRVPASSTCTGWHWQPAVYRSRLDGRETNGRSKASATVYSLSACSALPLYLLQDQSGRPRHATPRPHAASCQPAVAPLIIVLCPHHSSL